MADLPRVVLIGDSIRLGYSPLVRKRLAGRAEITGPQLNCGDSSRVREHLPRWAIEQQPSLVHFNCGLHDLRRLLADGRYRVEIERYEANLREIVARLQRTGATVLFATTTPVDDRRHTARGLAFERREADVLRYNEVAVGVMADAGVSVNDLYGLVVAGGKEHLLADDGVHLTRAGNELLAESVAAAIERESAALTFPLQGRVGRHS